jgi:hypothetical protein
MYSRAFANTLHSSVLASCAVIAAAGLSSPAWAEDIRFSHVKPGTELTVRPNQAIDVNRGDQRTCMGTVQDEVWGDDGRIAIPRGAQVEMRVAVRPDNDLVLHVDAVVVNGRRYDVEGTPSRFSSDDNISDDNIGGAIAAALLGRAIHGPAVRVPRDRVVSFELERSLNIAQSARDFDRNRGRDENERR